MDFNKLTEKMQDAIRAAQSLATRNGNQQIDVEHLLLALLQQDGGLATSILNKADVHADALTHPPATRDRPSPESLGPICRP